MALPASSVFEFRVNGTLNGSGYFTRGASGTDFSQQDAVQIAFTDLVIDGSDSTKATSAANPFTSAHIGNGIQMVSGTGFNVEAIPFEITAVAAGIATFDRSLGSTSSTGGTGDLGGAKSAAAILDAFFEVLTAGTTGHVETGTYALTENLIVAKDGSANDPIKFYGYNATRGDLDNLPNSVNKPLIAAGAFQFSFDNDWWFANFSGTIASADGFRADVGSRFINCDFNNISASTNRSACELLTDGRSISCNLQSVNGVGLVLGSRTGVYDIYVHDCAREGIKCALETTVYGFNAVRCGTWSNGEAAIDAQAQGVVIMNGTIDDCISASSGSAEGILTGVQPVIVRNVTISNCDVGINCGSTVENNEGQIITNINLFGNTVNKGTSKTNAVAYDYFINETNLDPEFADASSDDYQVGSNLQGAAIEFPNSNTDADVNIGFAQNKAGGAGGGTLPIGTNKGLIG